MFTLNFEVIKSILSIIYCVLMKSNREIGRPENENKHHILEKKSGI